MLRTISAFILSLAVGVVGRRAVDGHQRHHRRHGQGRIRARVLPGVTVTVTNIDTGDQRVVVTNESGLYRAPLLSLGTYRVAAELQGFKKFEQTGITLSRRPDRGHQRDARASARVTETITVTADAPLVDLAQDRAGPHADRSGDQDAAADLAQPLQLRAAAARRRRLREPTSSACRASPPTARCCASTTRSTAATTPRRIAPACARCRCRK